MLPKTSNNAPSTSALVHFPVLKKLLCGVGVLSHITCLLLLNWLVLVPILQGIYNNSWNIGLSTGNWNPPFSGPTEYEQCTVRVSGIEFHRLSINCNKRSPLARCCWNRVFIRGSITSEQTQPANPPWFVHCPLLQQYRHDLMINRGVPKTTTSYNTLRIYTTVW